MSPDYAHLWQPPQPNQVTGPFACEEVRLYGRRGRLVDSAPATPPVPRVIIGTDIFSARYLVDDSDPLFRSRNRTADDWLREWARQARGQGVWAEGKYISYTTQGGRLTKTAPKPYVVSPGYAQVYYGLPWLTWWRARDLSKPAPVATSIDWSSAMKNTFRFCFETTMWPDLPYVYIEHQDRCVPIQTHHHTEAHRLVPVNKPAIYHWSDTTVALNA